MKKSVKASPEKSPAKVEASPVKVEAVVEEILPVKRPNAKKDVAPPKKIAKVEKKVEVK